MRDRHSRVVILVESVLSIHFPTTSPLYACYAADQSDECITTIWVKVKTAAIIGPFPTVNDCLGKVVKLKSLGTLDKVNMCV